ncbi:hypothetical protein B0H15DRAFT_952818 [Mycena belliarum]|uniref:Uncharacterized protein n=1 Tax=Mycena belliarum TaxID=1033014 RepID=A0AAD6XR27_9AGAR|nr:hypothetical protein B0H15DRAFT_952818 [Mycena belliae]
MSSLLGRRAKAEAPPAPDLLRGVSEKLLVADPGGTENIYPTAIGRPTTLRRVTEPAACAEPANKKSRTLFRKITTKFKGSRTRSTSPSANNRRPAVSQGTASATAQEARNAALRARGLLPPLPMSVQEQQQDMRIAVVPSPESGETSALQRRPTAANRIKEEWEAKNRERLTEFRFGGNSPQSSPSQQNFPVHGLDAVKEVDTPLPSPLPSPDAQAAPQPDPGEVGMEFGQEVECKAPRAPPPTLSLARGHHLSPPLMRAWSDTPPEPHLFPLPPSPAPTSSENNNFASLMAAFAPTPPSENTPPLEHIQLAPASSTSLPSPPSPSASDVGLSSGPSGVETPRPPRGDATPRVHVSPTTLAPTRSASLPLDASETESNLEATSLLFDSADTHSHSTIDTDDASTGARMRGGGAGKAVRNSTFEPTAHHAIPVIVESPAEEREIVLSSTFDDDDDEPEAEAPLPSGKAPKRRATTDQVAPAAERRKSLGLSAMASIRRTMGFNRKSTGGAPSGFDATKLPPSPTLNAGFAAQQGQGQVRARGRPPAAGHAQRLSVSPTMHDLGSILHEVGKIEDEESRRMTEVAFM